jgi:hypothetical protein
MPANTFPIYTLTPEVANNGTTGMNQLILNAANDYTGIDADVSLVFTADATNGSFLQRLRFKAGGTNVATVARIYLNNGSAPTTATNNVFYGEVSLPATTASATVATVEIDYPMGFALPAGFRVYVGLATAVAAGWVVTPIGGNY